MNDLDYFLRIVKDCDTWKIEQARSFVQQQTLPLLIHAYAALDTWKQKRALVNLIQDQYSPNIKPIMLDFLRAPMAVGDEHTELTKAIALGFISEEYDQFQKYYGDRDFLRQMVDKCLKEHGLQIDSDAEPPSQPDTAQTTPPAVFTGSPDARLRLAALKGNLPEVERALADNANIETKQPDGTYVGCTPLLLSLIKGKLNVIDFLIEQGADINARRPKCGQTPLWWAANRGDLTLVKRLVAMGVDVNERDGFGGCALEEAASHGAVDVVRFLIGAGADIDARHRDGRKPIFFAAEYGHTEVVAALIESGNPVDEDRGNGRTPLTYAADNGHYAMVKMLLEKGATVDVRARGRYDEGLTPLMYAARKGSVRIVKLLVEAGAQVHLKADDGIMDYKGGHRGYRAIDFATGKRGERIKEILKEAMGEL